jgi:hypothetical protein
VTDRHFLRADVLDSDDTTRPLESSADPAATSLAGESSTAKDDLARCACDDAEDAASW